MKTPLQDAAVRARARLGDKESNERVIGQLVNLGILSIDFGFTAYATNAYLKVSGIGMQGKFEPANVSFTWSCQGNLLFLLAVSLRSALNPV